MVRIWAIVAAGFAVLAIPAAASAYGWPVTPVDQQHAIRGAFDDPRMRLGPAGLPESSFHFGVDIVAEDGTPVYAVAPGTVYLYPDAVAVRMADGHEFSYWHIDAAVAEHSFARMGDLLGFVRKGWGHVHFAESDGTGGYLNPLRPGALEPFSDQTTPVVETIDLRAGDGAVVSAGDVHGRVEVTTTAYDSPPIAPPPPWQDAKWTPALVRWRIVRDNNGEVAPWRNAADFRLRWEPPPEFTQIYAPDTNQNHPERPGRYDFWLAHGLDTTSLPNGDYRIEVEAEDTRGNVGHGELTIHVNNPQSLKTTKRRSA